MKQSLNSNKQLTVLDATLSDDNLGNEIILQAIYQELNHLFPEYVFNKIPRRKPSFKMLKRNRKSQFSFLGGTNALSGQWWANQRYGIPFSYLLLNNLILMGCGWWQWEENKPDPYSRFLLRKILQHQYYHAVRDSYTQQKLKDIGINNTLFTACPSMWGITKELCQTIPQHKSNQVVFTLTDYATNNKRDTMLINQLLTNYTSLYFFPQGSRDLTYLQNLIPDQIKKIHILKPHINALKAILLESIDYVGTRLHAGIQAIHQGRRSVIIGIDNRASTMKDDFNLPVISASAIDSLSNKINAHWETIINIPHQNIMTWKAQFKGLHDR